MERNVSGFSDSDLDGDHPDMHTISTQIEADQADYERYINALKDKKGRKGLSDSSSTSNFSILSDNHRTVSTNATMYYSEYRKSGEGFLSMQFMEAGIDENEDDKEGSVLIGKMVDRAKKMKKLADQRMGIPQVDAARIRIMADEISNHSFHLSDIFSNKSSATSASEDDELYGTLNRIDRKAKSVVEIAKRAQGVLKTVKDAKKVQPPPGVHGTPSGKDASEHLERMVKKLHCRHRKLKRYAEEIIAKRWKLVNLINMKDGKRAKTGDSEDEKKQKGQGDKPDDNLKNKMKMKKKGKKRLSRADIDAIAKNPIAKYSGFGKCSGGQEWTQTDPLWKVVHKVGLEHAEKCLAKLGPPKEKKKKKVTVNEDVEKAEVTRKDAVMPKFEEPTVEAQFNQSAVTIFATNYSRLNIIPAKPFWSAPEVARERKPSVVVTTVDKRVIANEYVDQWKRRSYAVGIFLIFLTAILQCAYMSAPRMGDNYVTYIMVESISGFPWTIPIGIYGMIFLGYLLGGMAVIKTASGREHSSSVKDYIGRRKRKFYSWYLMSLLFCAASCYRMYLCFRAACYTHNSLYAYHKFLYIEDIKITHFFQPFYKSLLIIFAQLACCGADGPGDYPQGPLIGWPKSCYIRVQEYDDYFLPPKPQEFGCIARVFKYSAMAMCVIGGTLLGMFFLMMIHPIYLYVYELFICMRSQEPEPWLEHSKE